MNDPRPLFEQAADQFADVLTAVRPEQLGRPTPCTEFDVRALLSHVVGGTRLYAHLGEGGGYEGALPEVEGVADTEWSAAYEDARRRFTKAWMDDAGLARTVALPWATMSGAETVGSYVLETVTHTWDLSRALGHPVALDQSLAATILPIARAALPADLRGGAVPFAAVREAPAGADAYEQLAAWLGRAV
ncbi:TIGR03086 family metal-binding protein [Streptomyces sp. NPDC049906]|uniref:TIGR03086 family metal-binding protein n=1 Tax=Streptomyces sp. NPDC049906 TaxID=3155656 RepID=UPI0034339BF3